VQSGYVDCMHADAEERSTTNGNTDGSTEPLTYNVEGAARALQVSTRQVWILIERGEIESFKMGRLRRIHRAALNAYVENLRGAA
jgi:excisionase family DNA binding protein